MTKLEPRKIDWTIPPKRLKYAREVYGFSKESVADFLGVTVKEIEEYESTGKGLNSVNFDKLCTLYDNSYEYFLGWSDEFYKSKWRGDITKDLYAVYKINQIRWNLELLRKLEKEVIE